MVVAAFAQFFFIISAGDRCNNDEGTEWECTITSSYFQSFAMLLNANFEFLDWKPDNWQQTAVSFCFAVVVGITQGLHTIRDTAIFYLQINRKKGF